MNLKHKKRINNMSKIITYRKHLAIVDFDKLPKSIKGTKDLYADKDNWYIECSNVATKKYYELRYGINK